MFYQGLTIVESQFARDVRTEFNVVRASTRRKRRKNWRVQRVEINRPGVLQAGSTLYVHPDLLDKFKAATSADRGQG